MTTLRQIFARMDDIQLEAMRNAVEDEIRDRDSENELGTLWPNGEPNSRGIAALFDVLTRGRK